MRPVLPQLLLPSLLLLLLLGRRLPHTSTAHQWWRWRCALNPLVVETSVLRCKAQVKRAWSHRWTPIQFQSSEVSACKRCPTLVWEEQEESNDGLGMLLSAMLSSQVPMKPARPTFTPQLFKQPDGIVSQVGLDT